MLALADAFGGNRGDRQPRRKRFEQKDREARLPGGEGETVRGRVQPGALYPHLTEKDDPGADAGGQSSGLHLVLSAQRTIASEQKPDVGALRREARERVDDDVDAVAFLEPRDAEDVDHSVAEARDRLAAG